MLIRDILNMKGGAIYSIGADGTVCDAVGIMVKNDIGSLVVNEQERMIGMLTFREVLRAVDAQGGNLADLRVRDVMVANPVSASPTDTIEHLRIVMTQEHVRYLPITEADKLLGVISFHDVAKAVINETSFENRLLKRYIKNTPDTDGAA